MAPLRKSQAHERKTKRQTFQPPGADATSAKRRKSHPRVAAIAGEASRTRSSASGERPPFEPAVEDSRGRYGEISYAKSWCGFLNARESTAAYKGWREKIKAYITVLEWNPTSLTASQLDTVLSFARSLPPVKGRIKLIKTNHRPEDVDEIDRQIKVLVRDTAKKLQATNDRIQAEQVDEGIEGDSDVPMAQYDWTSPYSPRPIRMHIVRRTGTTKAGHPFLGYPWYGEDLGGGIAWGVLASPNLKCLLGVLKRQHVEDPIQYPRYLIGATGLGASELRRQPSEPLPLSEQIFLYNDDDIQVWLLANPGKDPLDLLVLEARQDRGDDRDETPAPAFGGHPFFDRKAWERWGQWDHIGAGDGDDDDDDEGESLNDSGSQEEDNADHPLHCDENVWSGAAHTPDRRSSGIIIVDEGDDGDSESQRGHTSGSDYSPVGDPPDRRTLDSRHKDSEPDPAARRTGNSGHPDSHPDPPARRTSNSRHRDSDPAPPARRTAASRNRDSDPDPPARRTAASRNRDSDPDPPSRRTAASRNRDSDPDPPTRRTAASRNRDSNTAPSEKEQARELRAFLQNKPWMANHFRTPEAETDAPRPESVSVARRTREHRGPVRGHDGTMDTPTAESEPPEDGDIHSTESHPPHEPETFTPAPSTSPPPPTQNPDTTSESPAPTQSAPHGITNPHPPQQIAAEGSRDSPSPSATNTVAKRKGMAHEPNPKPDNKPEPPTQTAPRRGRGRRGRHRS